MSTPTPIKHPASQQGRTPSQFPGTTPSQLTGATPPVSTPFSNAAPTAFSPRNLKTSPQQFKKSPATSLLGQLPMAFDSPSTAAVLGLGVPGDMGADHVDDLRDMRLITRDDDKLKKLETILDILNKKKGLVSEAGLERLAQRNGFDCLPEGYTSPDGRKMRAVIIAGSSTQIDIVLDNNIVQNVTLAFPESSESTSKYMEPASKILLQDLRLPPNQSPLTKTLDKFAFNLEQLATLDKLSVMPAFDCRAALAGLYTSLHGLHEWTMTQLREDTDSNEKTTSMTTMCAKHGFPVMNARDRIGLSIQYWKEGRLIPPAVEDTTTRANPTEKIWSLHIGCSSMAGFQFPPARVSEKWLSSDFVKSDGLGGNKVSWPLDWQEPDNTSVPASEESKNAGMEFEVPSVVFTVTFDPPVILPQADGTRLYNFTESEPPPMPRSTHPPTYEQLFFPDAAVPPSDSIEHRTFKRRRLLTTFDKDGQAEEKTHNNSLYVYKQIYSMQVSEMAFSHPKQLINMLPLLRQWAFTSTLLQNSFGPQTELPKVATVNSVRFTKESIMNLPTREGLAAIMAVGDAKRQAGEEGLETRIDVIVWVHPTPHFQVTFPYKKNKANIMLGILENGLVEIISENIISTLDNGEVAGKQITKATLAKALEHMEDLCKWVEWIRSRLL